MRTLEWAEVALRRRTLSAASLLAAIARRTRSHRPRTEEERSALLAGVLAAYRRRVAVGELEWTGPRELRLRPTGRRPPATAPGPSAPSR